MPNIKAVVKWLLLLCLALSYKTLPFAYLVRFYWIVIRNLIIPYRRHLSNGKRNTYNHGVSNPLDVFKPVLHFTYVLPLEIDMYLHKLNLTYFVDLDIARTELVSQIFQKLFYAYFDNEPGHFKKARKILNIPYIPVAATENYYKKELSVFQKFEIRSRFLTWDKKWIFVLLKFITKKGKEEIIHSYTITKYVFKRGRITIAPEEILKICNYDSPEVREQAAKYFHLCGDLADTTELDELVDSF